MSIVIRNGRAYRYMSIRRNGRVTSEYRGSGALAAVAALFDEEDRQVRDEERAALEAEAAIERSITDYVAEVEELARAALIASGFHQHKRQWRRRRVQPESR